MTKTALKESSTSRGGKHVNRLQPIATAEGENRRCSAPDFSGPSACHNVLSGAGMLFHVSGPPFLFTGNLSLS